MGATFRKPVAVDSFQSLHEEADRLWVSFRTLLNDAYEKGGITQGIHLRYGSIHNQILQIHRCLKPLVEQGSTEQKVWFHSWHQVIQNLEAKYHLLRKAGLSIIQELEEPMLPHREEPMLTH